jgi:hypothetical protein
VQYVRISLVAPKEGRREEVVSIEDQLVEHFRSLPGFIEGYRLNSPHQVGRITVWDSGESADAVANNQHTLSLRSRLLPLIGDSIEYGMEAEHVKRD